MAGVDRLSQKELQLELDALKKDLAPLSTQSLQQSSWGFLDLFIGTSKVVTDDKVQITQRHFSFKKALFITCVVISVTVVLLMWLHPAGVVMGVGQLLQKQATMTAFINMLRVKGGEYAAPGGLIYKIGEDAAVYQSHLASWTNCLSAGSGGVVLGNLLGTIAKFVPGILLGVQGAFILGRGASKVMSFITRARAEHAHKKQGLDTVKTQEETGTEAVRGEKTIGKYQIGPLLHKMLNYALLLTIVGLCLFNLSQIGGTLLAGFQGYEDVLAFPSPTEFGYKHLSVMSETQAWVGTHLSTERLLKTAVPVLGAAVVASWFWDGIAALFLKASGKDVLNKELCRKKLYSLGVRTVSDVQTKRIELQTKIDQYVSDMVKTRKVSKPIIPVKDRKQLRETMLKNLEELRWLELLQPFAKYIIE